MTMFGFKPNANPDTPLREIAESGSPSNSHHAIEVRDLNVYYGEFRAVRDVNLDIERHKVTAIIGPSGCGKSTMLRAFNRMNELVPTAHADGEVLFRGQNIYAPGVDPVEVRRHVGMVFQKPNPFPKTIYENVAWGGIGSGLALGLGANMVIASGCNGCGAKWLWR
jgi:ABC-type phosphate transport system ATPase subunit